MITSRLATVLALAAFGIVTLDGPASASAPPDDGTVFDDGFYVVGQDIEPGIYTTDAFHVSWDDTTTWCSVEVFADLDATVRIHAENLSRSFRYHIELTDEAAAVEFGYGCTWTSTPATFDGVITRGTWRVPDEVPPGLYRFQMDDPDVHPSCTIATFSDLEANSVDIIDMVWANDDEYYYFELSDDAVVVRVDPVFDTDDPSYCFWTLVD